MLDCRAAQEVERLIFLSGLDIGFGWKARDALKLDRAELLDSMRELEPLYRLCRAAA